MDSHFVFSLIIPLSIWLFTWVYGTTFRIFASHGFMLRPPYQLIYCSSTLCYCTHWRHLSRVIPPSGNKNTRTQVTEYRVSDLFLNEGLFGPCQAFSRIRYVLRLLLLQLQLQRFATAGPTLLSDAFGMIYSGELLVCDQICGICSKLRSSSSLISLALTSNATTEDSRECKNVIDLVLGSHFFLWR